MADAVAPNFANRTMWTRDNLDVLRGLNSTRPLQAEESGVTEYRKTTPPPAEAGSDEGDS